MELVDEAVLSSDWTRERLPHTTMSSPSSRLSLLTSSLARPAMTRASSHFPHGARWRVLEKTTLGVEFNASAMSSVSVVCPGQYCANIRYVTAPSRIVSTLETKASWSRAASLSVASTLVDSAMKSSSPFGPAAKPSSVTNSWTMTLRNGRRYSPTSPG